MKIRAIRAAEVGPFTSGVALEGLSGGLDVLTGPNEHGKSTLLAALSALIGEKHTSIQSHVVALRCNDGAAPIVEADLEIGGRMLRLRKRFLAQKSATLTDLVSGETLRGGPAEEKFLTLLGAREPLRSFLWVAQGGSFELPDSKQKSAPALVGGLSALIEEEAANAAGSGRARRLATEVRARREALVTSAQGKAKAGGRLDQALRQRNELAAALEAARTKEGDARARLQRLATLREERAKVASPEAAQLVRDHSAAAAKAVADAERARERVRTIEERVKARQLVLDQARRALEKLERLTADHQRVAQATAADRSHLSDLADQRAVAEADCREAQSSLDVTAEVLTETRRQLAQANAAAHRRAAIAEAAELAGRLSQARAAATSLDEVAQRLSVNKATEPLVEEARQLAARLEATTAQIAAAAPRVVITYETGAAGQIVIDGRPIGNGERIAIEQAVELAIPGLGTIRIEPGEIDGRLPATERETCRQALTRVLDRIGAGDLTTAQALLGARRQDESDLATGRARLQAAAPKGIDALEAAHRAALARASGDPLPDVPDVTVLDARACALDDELQQRKSVLMDAQSRLRAISDEVVRIESRLAAERSRIVEIERELPREDERHASRDQLVAAVSAAESELGDAVRERTAWADSALQGAAYDALVADAARAAAAVVAFDQRRTAIDRAMAELDGALRRDGEEGVGAEIAGLEGELEAAEARVADLELEARAFGMLAERLERIGADHRDKMLRPIVDRLQPLLEALMPGARVALDGPLLVAGIERDGRIDVLARLSGGTREQIATLVRLAYADLMAARGLELPLVLDDALVFSDDVRLAAMIGLLAAAAKRHQVIVLSCHERALEPLLIEHGARRLSLAHWDHADVPRPQARAEKSRAGIPASGLVG